MSTVNSSSIIKQVRMIVKDDPQEIANRVFIDEEVDAALSDGFGMVSYGSANEGTSDSFIKALAKLYAGATLLYSLARDKARLYKWKSSLGEEVDSDQESKSLTRIADSMMAQVNSSLSKQIERMKDDVKLQTSAQGTALEFAPDLPKHRDVKFTGRVGKLNKPSDR